MASEDFSLLPSQDISSSVQPILQNAENSFQRVVSSLENPQQIHYFADFVQNHLQQNYTTHYLGLKPESTMSEALGKIIESPTQRRKRELKLKLIQHGYNAEWNLPSQGELSLEPTQVQPEPMEKGEELPDMETTSSRKARVKRTYMESSEEEENEEVEDYNPALDKPIKVRKSEATSTSSTKSTTTKSKKQTDPDKPKKRGRPVKHSKPSTSPLDEELSKLSIFQLRDELRKRGIPVGKGYKQELMERVRQAWESERAQPASLEPSNDEMESSSGEEVVPNVQNTDGHPFGTLSTLQNPASQFTDFGLLPETQGIFDPTSADENLPLL